MKFSPIEVVQRLIGPTKPIGETYTDEKRYANLKDLAELVDHLVFELIEVAKHKDRPEYSMQRAGKMADRYLNDLKRQLEPD